MKSEIKAAWLKALRGGEYEQGVGTLSTRGKYCCLGVLADVLQKEFPAVYPQAGCKLGEEEGYMAIFYDGGVSRTGGLPRALTEAIDMDFDSQSDLTRRNDNGQSFPMIADHIGETL